MRKSHYYPILLLLGSLLTTSRYAAQHKGKETKEAHTDAQNEQKVYTSGDHTFIDQEKDKVNQAALKQGLIHLFQRIQAKDGRKVFFFIGSTGAGKSLSILTLQGNTIKKEKHNPISANLKFTVDQYVLPKTQVPLVGDKDTGAINSTAIYYPDPNKPQYATIAFADTEGFFRDRKASSAEKCLSSTAFFYALKTNHIGGIVLVVSKPALDRHGRDGLFNMAYLLHKYFAKVVRNKTIKKSLLVLITKVEDFKSYLEALEKFKQAIQLCYQKYYATSGKNIGNSRLKRFLAMLLTHDVPKEKAGNMHNFTLDFSKFCFILPEQRKSVQKILDKRLKKLKPIPANDLSPSHIPLLSYMEASIQSFSLQLNEATKPLLKAKREIDNIKKQLEAMANKQTMAKPIEALERDLHLSRARLLSISKDGSIELVFIESHYESLPIGREIVDKIINKHTDYRLCKAFQYLGQEPIYKIVATYGPEAVLSENQPFSAKDATAKFGFIAKHFNITEKMYDSGVVIWQAIVKGSKGVKKDEWLLYHVTTGAHKAECRITFYARKSDRIATQLMIEDTKKRIKSLENALDVYKKADNYRNALESAYKELIKILENKQPIQQLAAWEHTAHMLQLFTDKILQDGDHKVLIKGHLANFREASQLKSILAGQHHNGNNQKNKPLTANINSNAPQKPSAQLDTDENLPRDHQPADDDVFDID